MTLDLAADQAVFFADFAEADEITITLNDGSTTRDVAAVINREDPAAYPDGGARVSRRTIMLKNDESVGVLPREVDQATNGTHARATFYWNLGDTSTVTKVINKIERHNAGIVLVEVLA